MLNQLTYYDSESLRWIFLFIAQKKSKVQMQSIFEMPNIPEAAVLQELGHLKCFKTERAWWLRTLAEQGAGRKNKGSGALTWAVAISKLSRGLNSALTLWSLSCRFQSVTDNTVRFYTHHLQENKMENAHKNPMLKKSPFMGHFTSETTKTKC